MEYKIENDYLIVTVKDKGAELTSIYDKRTHTEHLWQADPRFWGWHAPVLFPVVGRCKNDTVKINGNHFNMEKHGFARKSSFDFVEKTALSIKFKMTHNSITQKVYPFDFIFNISYVLNGKILDTIYEVVNQQDKTIYYSLGGHPALAVPFTKEEKYEDYYIEFPFDEQLEREFINEDGFFTGEKKGVLTAPFMLQLNSTIFDKDALIFKNIKSKTVKIRSRNHQRTVSVSFDDFDYLGLWAKNYAHYVCVEPWLGCADNEYFDGEFSTKEGIQQLQPNESKIATFSIKIDE
jgi:galactose mutarotase-like enzyme